MHPAGTKHGVRTRWVLCLIWGCLSTLTFVYCDMCAGEREQEQEAKAMGTVLFAFAEQEGLLVVLKTSASQAHSSFFLVDAGVTQQ